MKNTTKLLIGLVVVAAIIAGVIFLTQQKPTEQMAETTKVKIGGLPIAQGLPLFLALEKGYFSEVGIEAEWIKYEAPNQLVDAILSNQIDFTHTGGPMSIAAIADFKNPGKLKIYAVSGGNETVPNDVILIANDSDIKSLSDLKGKKLGILSGIQWRTIAQHILIQNNLIADKDIVLVELAPGLQVPALASGQIDALLAIEPIPTIIKEKNIGKELVRVPTIQYVSNPFYGGAGMVNIEFAKNNPEATRKILDVFARAVDEITNDPNSARQYLQKYTALDESLVSEVPIPIIKMYENFSQNDIEAVQKFLDIFPLYKIVDGKMDFTKVIYSPATK